MPAIVRKSSVTLFETRREIFHAISWQVRSQAWNPPSDLYETEEAYVVRMEIAGMREEDFEISFENNRLYISGTRPDLLERRAYHQMEIPFGRFTTILNMPSAVDIEEAVVEYKDGFLTVIFPKIK